jgi:hypothetical protein
MPIKLFSPTSYRIRVIVVLAVLIVAAVFIFTGHTPLLHKSRPVSASQATKGEVPLNSKAAEKSNPNPNQPSTSSNPKNLNNSGVVTLLTPTGSFVSNHHPNLGGSPAPNTESSVCTSTSGATCKITFTKDGVTKSLATETTDNGGSAYWDWKLQDIGLTAGSWQVQAEVSLSGQTKTATDAMDLTVTQ